MISAIGSIVATRHLRGHRTRCEAGCRKEVGASIVALSALREPVPFEVYEASVYLHGTKADLAVGDVLVPGRESNFEAARTMKYIYFTATLDAAVWGAELAVGE